MPALASPTTWREPHAALGYLFVLKPTVVFQAQINMATVTYPLTALTFDTVTTGAYTDIKPGMTLLLGSSAGGSDLGRQRVRAAATSSVIPMGRTPKGVFWGELNVSDNMYITVIELYEVWSKIPFITESGVSLKDQTTFAANIAQPPVANGGCAVAGFVDPITNVLTVNFDAGDSIIVDPGASDLTFSWDFQQGDTSTSETPTGIEFDPGFYYVELTVNDGTRSHLTRIPVYAAERSGVNAPASVDTESVTLRAEGATASYTIRAQSLDIGDYPYGTLLIYFEEEYYTMIRQTLAGPAGRERVKFVGWIDNEPTAIQYSGTGADKKVTLQGISVAQRLAKLPGFGQIVELKGTPTTWQQMKEANIDRYLHHLLYWHSTALEVSPFSWSGQGSSYPFKSLSSDGQSLYDQVDQRARAIAYRLTCTRRGELLVRADPNRQDVGVRTAVEIVDLTENDWSSADYDISPAPKIHWLNGSAVKATAAAIKSFFCIAPGATPGQGVSSSDAGNQLVRTQSELNVRTGHDYARINAVLGPVRLTLVHGGDAGLDPAYMEWVTWSIDTTQAAQRGVTIPASTRFLLLETQITSDLRNHSRKTTIQMEREVFGINAETYTPPPVTSITPDYPAIPGGDTYGNWPEDPDTVFPDDYPITNPPTDTPPIPDASGNMVLLATDDTLMLTTNFRRSNTLEGLLITPDLGAGEAIKQAIWSGFGVDVYVLVNDGTDSRVYYTTDALASTVEWVASASISGTYTQIEAMSTQGQVKIKGVVDVPVSTCDLTTWTTYVDADTHGTIEYQDETQIVVTATLNTNGSYYAIIISPDDNLCCQLNGLQGTWDGMTFTPGGSIAIDRFNNGCGEPINVETPDTIIGEDFCGRMVEWVALVPFTVQWTVGDDCASGTATSTRVAYSSDYGATFATPQEVTPSLSADVGFDTQKIGNVSLVAAVGQVMIATDPDGAYTAYGDPLPTGIAANCLFVPRFTFAGGSNVGTDTPQYIVLSEAINGDDESAYRVTVAGTVFTNITPFVSGTYGAIVSPNAFDGPWKIATTMVGIFDFAGTRKLLTTQLSGGSWSNRGNLTADAAYVRMRKGDDRRKELYVANGEDAVYSPDFGVTLTTKVKPFSGIIRSIEVYG